MDKTEIEKILIELRNTAITYEKIDVKPYLSSLTALIIKWLESKKDGYARGLCEQIGSLLMASEGMREGFKEYKSLKEIERQRNIVYNQLITELIGELR